MDNRYVIKLINNMKLNYQNLQQLLPNDEIHYISDSTEFFIDNQIKSKQFNNNTYILFEYTIECFPETIEILTKNNIKHTVLTDELDLSYIII